MFIPIHSGLLLSHHSAWTVALHPARRNHPTMKHSITALTMLLIQQCPAKALRARSLWPSLTHSLFFSRSIQLARIGIDIISLLHPSGLGVCVCVCFVCVCVHGFRRGCWHSFSTGPLKRLKRPHDRYVISWCSRPAVGRTEHDRRPIVIADSRFPPVIMKSYRYRTFNHRIHSTLMSTALPFAFVHCAICTCLSFYKMYCSRSSDFVHSVARYLITNR